MMNWCVMKWLWVSLVLLLLQLHNTCSWGCLEEERIALLQFKALRSNCITDGDDKYLSTWVDDDDDERGSTIDCCSWERVQCNATTGRVIQLNLGGAFNVYYLRSGCSLNVTLFSTFKELQQLNLSYNEFDGWIHNEGFERLVGLRKLKVVDLTYNNFNSSILPSLGELKSLKILSVSSNWMQGPVHLEEFISSLQNLKSLDLSLNNLEAFSQKKQGSTSMVVELPKLESLNLYGNWFNNSILPFLGALKSLRTLSLGLNYFKGSLVMEELVNLQNLQSLDLGENNFNFTSQAIQEFSNLRNLKSLRLSGSNLNFSSQGIQALGNLPDLQLLDLSYNNINSSSQAVQALCGMKRLQELYLSGINFEGILPPCLKNLTSLRILDLSSNQFKGNISSSLITSLSSLSHISLGYNNFEGIFTFKSFANNSKLEVIDLRNCGNKLEVETEHPPWVPLFQLKELYFSNCNLNKQSSNAFPSFLSSQYNLEIVDLSHCNLTGMFPPWLLKNNKMLNALVMRNNSLKGHFLLQSDVHKVAYIDISTNSIDGSLQENIGNIFPNLVYLNLSKNGFEGGIPSSIGNMSSLIYLDLSDNNFIGEIPNHMATGCNLLRFFGISNNRLHGQVFPSHFNFSQLTYLYLHNNSFSGNISIGLSNCNQLMLLDISNNQLTGRIPSWIGNLTYLIVLRMQDNLLQGEIPVEFQILEQLEFLDLSQNDLSGPLIPLLNSTNLRHLHLQGNGFIGSPSPVFINDSNLMTLDIRNNDLCGGIPNWIGALSSLRVLLLQRNHLNGTIPDHLCHLDQIRLMDLSHNSLSSSIPRCFNNISFGRMKDLDSISELIVFIFGAFDFFIGGIPEEIEFMTKSQSMAYRGDILNYMSGIDLSCNNLIGDIPHEIGALDGIHALNFSHNQLTGSIPKSFSNLKQMESLDLSYNRLTGRIPSELTTLYNLAVFTVAHNNLSGKTPEMKEQFSTFDNSSYEGNPYLCGWPLPKSISCPSSGESTNESAIGSNDGENEHHIDVTVFIATFAASYVVCFLGIATILYINPYWRKIWFHLIGVCLHSCQNFLFDIYYKLCFYVYRFGLFLE